MELGELCEFLINLTPTSRTNVVLLFFFLPHTYMKIFVE